jgi:hypothetical protein
MAVFNHNSCSGAYILLAEEEASNVADALELFTKGAEAGERHLRRLNSQYLTHHQADFWMSMSSPLEFQRGLVTFVEVHVEKLNRAATLD